MKKPEDEMDATQNDHLVEATDNRPTEEDGPQDIPQEPMTEDEAAEL